MDSSALNTEIELFDYLDRRISISDFEKELIKLNLLLIYLNIEILKK